MMNNARIITQYYDLYFNDRKDVKVILDIGANEFRDTKILHSSFKQEKIYAFEPRLDPAKSNHWPNIGDRVEIFNLAVSDVDKKNIDFYIIPWWQGASSLLKPKRTPGVEWTMKEDGGKLAQVNVVTINQFAKDNNIKQIDMIWMDIQGNELRALKGMTDHLDKIKIIQTEAGVREYYEGHTLFHEIEEFLKPYGFEVVYNVLESGLPFVNTESLETEFETDVVFVNKNLAQKRLKK